MQFTEEMPGAVIAQKVIDNMESDDAADFLSELLKKNRKRFCKASRILNRPVILLICSVMILIPQWPYAKSLSRLMKNGNCKIPP